MRVAVRSREDKTMARRSSPVADYSHIHQGMAPTRATEQAFTPSAADALDRYWVVVLANEGARVYDAEDTRLTTKIEQMKPLLPGNSDMDLSAQHAASDRTHLDLLRDLEHRFRTLMADDPRPVVVVGPHRSLAAFHMLTRHREYIAGVVHGDFLHLPSHRLAPIVWPVVFSARTRHVAAQQAQSYPQATAHMSERPRIDARKRCDDD